MRRCARASLLHPRRAAAAARRPRPAGERCSYIVEGIRPRIRRGWHSQLRKLPPRVKLIY